jgi:copper homeostasis protein
MRVLVEACVDSLASARAAAVAGADRLELCQNLAVGGTTPTRNLLAETHEGLALPLQVMIRPRGGDFCYTGDEIAAMLRDIAAARDGGAEGVVLGALTSDGRVQVDAVRRLRDAAGPLSVTFHRAFDQTCDPFEALAVLLELGIERLLTSGQAPTAAAGIPLLKELVTRGAGRISILAAGGIRGDNVQRIVAATGVSEVHLRTGPNGEWVRQVIKSVNSQQ